MISNSACVYAVWKEWMPTLLSAFRVSLFVRDLRHSRGSAVIHEVGVEVEVATPLVC